MIEIYQRGYRDWAIYVDNEYKGTVSKLKVDSEFVCTHSAVRYQSRDDAINFLVSRVPQEMK